MSDFDAEFGGSIEEEMREIRGALLNDQIAVLSPAEPIRLATTATVDEAIHRMLVQRQPGVMIVAPNGRLVGIFTERDVVTRVLGQRLDPRRTQLGAVMTPNPEALRTADRVAYAVHCMSVAGYRTVPLVDGEQRPIGVVTVSDVIRWLANLFPEAVLNLPPGGKIKHPDEVDGA